MAKALPQSRPESRPRVCTHGKGESPDMRLHPMGPDRAKISSIKGNFVRNVLWIREKIGCGDILLPKSGTTWKVLFQDNNCKARTLKRPLFSPKHFRISLLTTVQRSTHARESTGGCCCIAVQVKARSCGVPDSVCAPQSTLQRRCVVIHPCLHLFPPSSFAIRKRM